MPLVHVYKVIPHKFTNLIVCLLYLFFSLCRYPDEKESFSELLSGRYPECSVLEETQSHSQAEPPEPHTSKEKPQDETEGDNFGEIIKKTMVESVTAWNLPLYLAACGCGVLEFLLNVYFCIIIIYLLTCL